MKGDCIYSFGGLGIYVGFLLKSDAASIKLVTRCSSISPSHLIEFDVSIKTEPYTHVEVNSINPREWRYLPCFLKYDPTIKPWAEE